MFTDDLVVLDFETTGLSPNYGDRITEAAAVRLKSGKIVDRYQSLANCGVRIPPFITDYTGITQAMVDNAPPVRRVLGELLEFIGDTAVVAHNAAFDQRFLDSECALAKRAARYQPFICSVRVSRRIYPGFRSYSLPTLASQLKISYQGAAHRAGADAEVTANVVVKIGRDLRARHRGLPLDAQLLRQIMRMPVARAEELLQRRAG
jgi:DNA polymerase III subunit epsilon